MLLKLSYGSTSTQALYICEYARIYKISICPYTSTSLHTYTCAFNALIVTAVYILGNQLLFDRFIIYEEWESINGYCILYY